MEFVVGAEAFADHALFGFGDEGALFGMAFFARRGTGDEDEPVFLSGGGGVVFPFGGGDAFVVFVSVAESEYTQVDVAGGGFVQVGSLG